MSDNSNSATELTFIAEEGDHDSQTHETGVIPILIVDDDIQAACESTTLQVTNLSHRLDASQQEMADVDRNARHGQDHRSLLLPESIQHKCVVVPHGGSLPLGESIETLACSPDPDGQTTSKSRLPTFSDGDAQFVHLAEVCSAENPRILPGLLKGRSRLPAPPRMACLDLSKQTREALASPSHHSLVNVSLHEPGSDDGSLACTNTDDSIISWRDLTDWIPTLPKPHHTPSVSGLGFTPPCGGILPEFHQGNSTTTEISEPRVRWSSPYILSRFFEVDYFNEPLRCEAGVALSECRIIPGQNMFLKRLLEGYDGSWKIGGTDGRAKPKASQGPS